MTDDILAVKELADQLKLNGKTTYRLVSKGDILGFKIGGSWRFERTEIEKWTERQSEKQARLGSKSA